jgi:hypothetical protein
VTESPRSSTSAAEATSIEVAPSAAPALFGTSDPAAIVERMGDVAGVLMQAVRERGLSRRYGDAEREFLHIEAWQFLGSLLNVWAVVRWTRRLEDPPGWEARAEAVAGDGRILGAGEGMCLRTEPGRRTATEQAIRAMAQVRARRGALRSVLAFVAAIGGLDLADPDAPVTRAQVVALHTLAGKQGYSREEAHGRAGVASFNDLTREQAADLLEAWSELPGDSAGNVAPEAAVDPELAELSLEELWERAVARYGSRVRVLSAYVERFGAGEGGLSAGDLTESELWELLRDA